MKNRHRQMERIRHELGLIKNTILVFGFIGQTILLCSDPALMSRQLSAENKLILKNY